MEMEKISGIMRADSPKTSYEWRRLKDTGCRIAHRSLRSRRWLKYCHCRLHRGIYFKLAWNAGDFPRVYVARIEASICRSNILVRPVALKILNVRSSAWNAAPPSPRAAHNAVSRVRRRRNSAWSAALPSFPAPLPHPRRRQRSRLRVPPSKPSGDRSP